MSREHVVPTGDMHLVFRLSAQPLRIFKGADDLSGTSLGCALVGGPRTAFYCKATSADNYSVGVQLFPGAAELLFCARADELAGRHTNLEDLWGRAAQLTCEDLRSTAQREFREFTGVTPQAYRKLAPEFSHHIQVNSVQDNARAAT